MNRFARGMITGAVMGLTSAALFTNSNNKSVKKMRKTSKKAMGRAGNVLDDLADMMK